MEPISFKGNRALDTKVEPLPNLLTHRFEWEDGQGKFRYVAQVRSLWVRSILGELSIQGDIVITKYKEVPVLWWDVWHKLLGQEQWWKKQWEVSSHSDEISPNQMSARGYLTSTALGQGIAPTELLFDKSLGPIGEQLREELCRMRSAVSSERVVQRTA